MLFLLSAAASKAAICNEAVHFAYEAGQPIIVVDISEGQPPAAKVDEDAVANGSASPKRHHGGMSELGLSASMQVCVTAITSPCVT